VRQGQQPSCGPTSGWSSPSITCSTVIFQVRRQAHSTKFTVGASPDLYVFSPHAQLTTTAAYSRLTSVVRTSGNTNVFAAWISSSVNPANRYFVSASSRSAPWSFRTSAIAIEVPSKRQRPERILGSRTMSRAVMAGLLSNSRVHRPYGGLHQAPPGFATSGHRYRHQSRIRAMRYGFVSVRHTHSAL